MTSPSRSVVAPRAVMSGCMSNALLPPRHSLSSRTCLKCYLSWACLDSQREDESLDQQLFDAYIKEQLLVLIPPLVYCSAAFCRPFRLEKYEILADYETRTLYVESYPGLYNLEEIEIDVGDSLAVAINAHVLSLIP